MKKRFAGRVALVTGGASGIGKVTALAFAREGASVLVCADANIKGGEETALAIRAAGGEATFVRCDVSREADVAAMVEHCVATYGRVDYAFNNAGIGPDGKRVPILPIVDYTEKLWDRMVDINLKGVLFCLKYEIRQMLKHKSGAIVNTSSVGGLKPIPGFAAYNASKSGLIGLTKTAALECASSGIRVNAILPGPTGRTLLMDNLSSSGQWSEDFEKTVPMGRIAEPEEMAAAVIWLCSDAASFVTGVAMPVDGALHVT